MAITTTQLRTHPGRAPEAVEPVPGPTASDRGFRIDAQGLGRTVRGRRRILDDVSLTILPGRVVAIVGGSGAGKSTLLDALAGVAPATVGTVAFDGVDLYRHLDAYRSHVGYVPQDDILHRSLPLAVTLRHAARLRLPAGTSPDEIARAVDDVLVALDLRDRADVVVGSLSGGQRKRASIAVELLARPRVFFLDEPTSGLDPATAAALVRTLRSLAAAGCTVVFTTHSTADIAAADDLVVVAHGHLAYHGPTTEALAALGTTSFEGIYEVAAPTSHDGAPGPRTARASAAGGSPPPARSGPGFGRQWRTLTRRNLDIVRRDRLTLGILLGSPALVIGMFAILFRPGAFSEAAPSPTAALMITYWMAFAAFFFGLTYGLLQICTEHAIVRRERFVGLQIGAYLLSKVTVLLPVLLAIDVVMLAVLRALDRLPATGAGASATLAVTLLVDSIAALALGLLASAAVSEPSQATLTLPMLCFPAVLFSGAILPVPQMAFVGRAISAVTPARWAFEAVGRTLDLSQRGAGPGADTLGQYGDAFTGGPASHWIVLGAFTLAFLAGAHAITDRRSRVERPRRSS